jgi:hypothetical protein
VPIRVKHLSGAPLTHKHYIRLQGLKNSNSLTYYKHS